MKQNTLSIPESDHRIEATRNDLGYPTVAISVTLLHCIYVVTWYLQLGGRIGLLDTIRFEFLLAAALIFLLGAYLPIAEPSPFQRKILVMTYPFLCCIALGLLFSYDFETSWDVLVERFIKAVFFGIFIVAFVRGPTQLKFFLGACVLAWLKIEEESMLGILTGSMLWYNQGILRLHGSTGMYAHPNNLASLALGSLPFLYFLYPLVSRPLKVILAAQGTSAVAIIVYSGSRAGYLGLVFFLLYLLKESKHRFRAYSAVVILVLLSFYVIPDQYWARFQTIQTGQEIDGASMDARKEILNDALDILEKHPFGVGIGVFPVVRTSYFGRSQDTHNLYLEVATNLGIQGLVGFLIFVFAMAKGLSYLKKDLASQLQSLEEIPQTIGLDEHREHVKALTLINAAASAVLAFLLIRLFLGLFGHSLYEVHWWFVFGLTVALLNMSVWAGARTERLLGQIRKIQGA